MRWVEEGRREVVQEGRERERGEGKVCDWMMRLDRAD